MKQVLAVDGDTLAYRTAAVCEDHFLGAAESIIDSTLQTIATETGISDMRIYISGEGNFRNELAKTVGYKANRATMVRPQFLEATKEYLVTKYGAVHVDGYEADDAIATDMTINNAIHCGVDKDILQIPGKHYNYVKKEWQTISTEEATIRLFRQILMGDKSDNVPGLKGIGEAKAENAIDNELTAEIDAINFYINHCANKMPEIKEPLDYFVEQRGLIEMVKDISLYCIDFDETVYIEPYDEGFTLQEGSDIKLDVKL